MADHPINISKILDALVKAAESKNAFVPANDPMMASLGAGNPPMPAGGPMPGGPAPVGGPPPGGPAGGLDLGALLGGLGGAPPGGAPPVGPDMAAMQPPPPPGPPPGQTPEMEGQAGASPETKERTSSIKAVDMTRDEFQSLVRSSIDQVINKQMGDVLRAIDDLSKRVDTILDRLEEVTGRAGGEDLGGRGLR